jgi:hypothetical protein
MRINIGTNTKCFLFLKIQSRLVSKLRLHGSQHGCRVAACGKGRGRRDNDVGVRDVGGVVEGAIDFDVRDLQVFVEFLAVLLVELVGFFSQVCGTLNIGHNFGIPLESIDLL